MSKIKLSLFFLVIVLQLFTVSSLIFFHIDVVREGKEYAFKLVPIDPFDFLRGNYLELRFDASAFTYRVDAGSDSLPIPYWGNVYVQYAVDSKGLSYIKSLSTTKPKDINNYFKTKINNKKDKKRKRVIDFSFDRFYINEELAKAAERLYGEAKNVYAIIAFKNGRGVLKNVYVSGVPIQEEVEKQLKRNER